jgi:hypothetical protein
MQTIQGNMFVTQGLADIMSTVGRLSTSCCTSAWLNGCPATSTHIQSMWQIRKELQQIKQSMVQTFSSDNSGRGSIFVIHP